jgi:hypothetical protein
VIIQPERFAFVGADSFIKAIAEKEAVVEDRDFGFLSG